MGPAYLPARVIKIIKIIGKNCKTNGTKFKKIEDKWIVVLNISDYKNHLLHINAFKNFKILYLVYVYGKFYKNRTWIQIIVE